MSLPRPITDDQWSSLTAELAKKNHALQRKPRGLNMCHRILRRWEKEDGEPDEEWIKASIRRGSALTLALIHRATAEPHEHIKAAVWALVASDSWSKEVGSWSKTWVRTMMDDMVNGTLALSWSELTTRLITQARGTPCDMHKDLCFGLADLTESVADTETQQHIRGAILTGFEAFVSSTDTTAARNWCSAAHAAVKQVMSTRSPQETQDFVSAVYDILNRHAGMDNTIAIARTRAQWNDRLVELVLAFAGSAPADHWNVLSHVCRLYPNPTPNASVSDAPDHLGQGWRRVLAHVLRHPSSAPSPDFVANIAAAWLETAPPPDQLIEMLKDMPKDMDEEHAGMRTKMWKAAGSKGMAAELAFALKAGSPTRVEELAHLLPPTEVAAAIDQHIHDLLERTPIARAAWDSVHITKALPNRSVPVRPRPKM